MIPTASHGRALANNTFLNLIGQVMPAVTAVVLLPYTVHGLGVVRFGILSLGWVLLGYLGLFDLGLGRATIRFVADALGRQKPEEVPALVWTSLAIQLVSGSIGGAILIAITPLLIPNLIKVPGSYVEEARGFVQLLGVGLPILVCSSGLKGVLEAHQRFDLVNVVRSIGGTLMFAIPAGGVLAGLSLPAIMVALDLSLVLVAAGYFAFALAVVRRLRQAPRVHRHLLRPLLFFGGWVSVSGLIVPVLVYGDRILLSAIISVALLAYYTVPYDLVSRLQLIPWSLSTAIFPAFSKSATGTPAGLQVLYARSLKYLLLVISPLSLGVLVGAGPLLSTWLGPSFASKGTLVMQLLAVGILLNALSQVPANLLDAVGRPDLRAKIFLSYAPIYLAAVWFLINAQGLNGAALAWTLRGALELCVFFGMAWRIRDLDLNVFVANRTMATLAVFGAFALLGYLVSRWIGTNLLDGAVVTAALVTAFVALLWNLMLDELERRDVISVVWLVLHGNRTGKQHSESAV